MTITISNKSEIKNAKGELNSKKCKPVICITTGEVYTSATDAAEANETNVWSMSRACNGKQKTLNKKRFCYLADVSEHLEEMTTYLHGMHERSAEMEKKAAAYDAIMAEREAERKAKEAHEAEVAKIEAKLSNQREIRARIEAELKRAIELETETENYLNELKRREV